MWPQAIEAVDGSRSLGQDTPNEDDASPGHPGPDTGPAANAAVAVSEHCRAVIDAVGAECVGVKLQLACFERLGAPGSRALAETVQHAKSAGLVVIADGKRGDVPVTASAYAQALFGSTPTPWGDVAGLGADAATVNPLLGSDSLEPFVDGAAEVGAGLFALVRTSNPGADEIEALTIEGSSGETVTDRIAATVNRLGAASVGPAGLSSVGAVVGATVPAHVQRLRDAMPNAVFLMPGVGAQGGRVEDLAAAFGAGRASALITVSRALVNAGEGEVDPTLAARAAAKSLREEIWSVSA